MPRAAAPSRDASAKPTTTETHESFPIKMAAFACCPPRTRAHARKTSLTRAICAVVHVVCSFTTALVVLSATLRRVTHAAGCIYAECCALCCARRESRTASLSVSRRASTEHCSTVHSVRVYVVVVRKACECF